MENNTTDNDIEDTKAKVEDVANDKTQNADAGKSAGKINIENTKNSLAPRPWRLGAVEVPTRSEDGIDRTVWVSAVVDANGKAVCCGDTVDMEFIIKLENSYQSVLNLLNASGAAMANAVETLSDFECRKTKFFKFN